MVNFPASDSPSVAWGDLLDRALAATDVAFVVTDALDPAEPIVWVNDGFTRTIALVARATSTRRQEFELLAEMLG